ncbi:peptidase S8/S53 domain-containing protein [Lobosporangium transversale]|uniref:Peptidase S8/S53 domain-containing protein n=1 Tax=Lobosporangium transversale TaxID=64571 RepID=A0A1Y2GTT4_9FUNG|nr:peptidase S8/S53 domain-containing protein [Lobosporangium transversale]ORZ20140.1 peptidase S8/S53 domain-containing protein [Lobosporangium transversale]|eukprot:XP_021882680.1 peptidase S8/S53 domain-containing protein [Lobosporangium transversale]
MHSNAYSSLDDHQVSYKVRNEYGIFNGVAISVLSAHDGNDLAVIPTIKNVWPIRLYSIPKPRPSAINATDPAAASYHSMTGVDIVHRKLKLTGRGVKIGVIDSGIDYNHPAFAARGATKGCFGKNCRIAYGWDFAGDEYNGGNEPTPGPNPMDCQGHGTHVAGIIGADALNIKSSLKPPQPFVGVAPEVTLGAYRVFGCTGSTTDDLIMAAMERAYHDGMDLINMSLGGGSAFKSNPPAVLGDKLIARGMAIIVAAGNDGEHGVWMVSDSSLGDLSTSVGSFDNIVGTYAYFTYAGGRYSYVPSDAYGKAINLPISATLVPVLHQNGTLADGCNADAYGGLNVKGKVVLVLGDLARCKSGDRGTIAKEAGAAGILIQTIPFGLGGVGGIPEFPMASIEYKTGTELIAAYKQDSQHRLTWSKTPASFWVEGGGRPSSFSSLGVDGDLRSKPDVSAPGGNILSAFPLKLGGYKVMSGTSMAAPYFAGAHALYIQAKKTKPRGDDVRKVFKNTATFFKDPITNTYTSAAKQGAGLLNVFNALTATSSITPDHIDLLDTSHLQRTVQITLSNHGKGTETYTLSHVPADALNSYPGNNTFPLLQPVLEADYASVTFSTTSVRIPAGRSATVTIRFREPAAGKSSQFPLYSGYLTATPTSKDGIPISIPYIGLKGDVSQVPIMDTSLGFPALSALDVATGNLTDVSKKGDYLFDLTSMKPVVLTRLGSHTPSGEIRIYDSQNVFRGYLSSKTGTAYGPLGRHKMVDDQGNLVFTSRIWEGQVMESKTSTVPVKLPAGVYRIVVASQRKLTKGVYPKDYEVFEIGKVQI